MASQGQPFNSGASARLKLAWGFKGPARRAPAWLGCRGVGAAPWPVLAAAAERFACTGGVRRLFTGRRDWSSGWILKLRGWNASPLKREAAVLKKNPDRHKRPSFPPLSRPPLERAELGGGPRSLTGHSRPPFSQGGAAAEAGSEPPAKQPLGPRRGIWRRQSRAFVPPLDPRPPSRGWSAAGPSAAPVAQGIT